MSFNEEKPSKIQKLEAVPIKEENRQRLSEEFMQIISQEEPKDITSAVAGKVGYNTVQTCNLEEKCKCGTCECLVEL